MGMSRSSDVPSTKIKFKLKALKYMVLKILNLWKLHKKLIIVGWIYDSGKSYNFDLL